MFYELRKILFSILSSTLMYHNVLSKTNSNIAEILHRPIRELAFPENSNMGIFVALAVPLEDPLSSISLSYFFEANYDLPPNITFFEPWNVQGKRKRRSIDRVAIYRILENKFESSGYSGRDCLLRAICETSEFPLRHNGVIGDIVHVLFTHQITMFVLSLWYFTKSTHVSGVKNITHGVLRHMRSIEFPEGSNTGILFAIGIPVNIPDKSIAVSLYFEANYGLPWNLSYYREENYFARRSLDRQLVYRVSIKKLKSLGYPGLDCLLRIICEAAKYPLSENGVLGDILQIVFTPSSSRNENLPDEIIEAEREQHCDLRYKKCPVNPFDLVSNHVSAI